MRDLYLLLRPRMLGLKNRLYRSEKSARKRPWVMGALGLAFCGGMFVISCRVLLYFQSTEMIGDILAKHLLSMVLLTFFSLLIFSNIITALSNLYLSKDLEFCHSAPISVEALFISRAVNTFLDSSWMVIVFGLPIFMAYAYVYRPAPLFYVTLIHINLAMAVIASGLGILVTIILVHVFPARRTKDIILLLSILMVIALYLFFRFLRPERLVNPEAFFTIIEYMGALKAPDSPYLPSHWVARILWDGLTSRHGGGKLFETLLTWSTAGAVVVVNVWLAGFIYFKGFSKSQEARQRRSGGKPLLNLLIRTVTAPYKKDLAAIMAKDIRIFFRDNSQWSQLLLLGALVIVYVYNFSVLPLDKSPMRLDFLQNELAFLNMGLAGFVLSAVCTRFVYTAVSAEGESYWVIRSSPLSMKRFLWGKYVLFLIPMLVLGETLIVLTNWLLEVTPFMMGLTTATMFLMVFGIIALGIGFGAIYPRFKHENIAQVSTGFGGLLYMILSALFIGLVIILEAGPVYMLFMADVRGHPMSAFQWLFVILSFGAVLAISGLAIFKPMKTGIERLHSPGMSP
ncbi:MAG: hypothetical protein U5R49_03190 [Deltaproteobacteria bacterium]|nr:hypothetical protein [Deltaproteobacteria bacterium]